MIPILLLTIAAGCGGDGSRGDGPDGDIDVSGLEYRPCDPRTRVGTFEVELAAEFTGVSGTVSDAAVPANVPDLAAEDGDCRLWAPRSLFCDPACVPGETCGDDGACIAYPAARDVGTVTVAGLEVEVEMTPRPPGNYYTNADPLPHPGFAPGVGLELRSAGGDYEPMRFLGWGIDALVATEGEIAVARGAPASLAWEAPADPGPARLHAVLAVNRHGGAAARIECDVPDTGAFEVPAALVDPLLDAGLSGFPMFVLSRRSADSVEIEPGCVEFLVASSVERSVSIPGLDSCTDDGDCAGAETCQPDLTCG